MRSRSPKRSPTEPKGIPFEVAVTALQGMMDSNATVTHNERIKDRLGHWRQFDVVIRAKVGGHDILGVIECKDLNRRVGTPEVNAFADKARNARANLTLLVSRKGFTKQALELAEDYGIGTFSLLKAETEEHGLVVGVTTYAEVFAWEGVLVTVHFAGAERPLMPMAMEDISLRGRPVLDWIVRELHSTRGKVTVVGWHTLWLRFHASETMKIAGRPYIVSGLEVRAERTRAGKTKQLQWSGQALYDWKKKVLVIPNNGQLVTKGWKADFSDWEDFQGAIPPLGGKAFVDFRFTVHRKLSMNEDGMNDLNSFASVEFIPPAT
jgi:hypothetical protein